VAMPSAAPRRDKAGTLLDRPRRRRCDAPAIEPARGAISPSGRDTLCHVYSAEARSRPGRYRIAANGQFALTGAFVIVSIKCPYRAKEALAHCSVQLRSGITKFARITSAHRETLLNAVPSEPVVHNLWE